MKRVIISLLLISIALIGLSTVSAAVDADNFNVGDTQPIIQTNGPAADHTLSMNHYKVSKIFLGKDCYKVSKSTGMGHYKATRNILGQNYYKVAYHHVAFQKRPNLNIDYPTLQKKPAEDPLQITIPEPTPIQLETRVPEPSPTQLETRVPEPSPTQIIKTGPDKEPLQITIPEPTPIQLE